MECYLEPKYLSAAENAQFSFDFPNQHISTSNQPVW